ncbi:MAG TPA: carboxypeptidase-like regulatory domain-containing protein, partial [Flavisolibacter sp.]|nr:carboxypeptidase-like regulatory domain-containing protein [Flavisolibacter sp.]
MNVFKRLLVAAICLLSVCSIEAQTRQITGTIISEDDNTPLQGVTVTNRNTNQSAQTNAAGTFQIAAERGHVLVLSYVGFGSQNYTVTNDNIFSITMSSSKRNILEDVVVVGYSTQRRGNLTGAV